MRKISAHYAWDGLRLVKYPILTLHTDHSVVDLVSTGDRYQELYGVEFYGGILIPSFIDVCPTESPTEYPETAFNRYYRNGSLYLLVQHLPLGLSSRQIFIQTDSLKPHDKSPMTVWESMMQEASSMPDLEDLFSTFITRRWHETGYGHIGGGFLAGQKPGVLLLEGADLKTKKLTHASSIKVLDVPIS